jgi:histidinol-phosphatase
MDAMLVCSGAAELWVEPSAKPWDLAPLQILAQESGALHFDFAGHDTIYGGSAVICTPAVQAEARAFLGLP